jgi:hypothetical protein
MNRKKRTEGKTKVGEYRSKRFHNLGARLADAQILLDQQSRVNGRDDSDTKHLEIANRYAMKLCASVMGEVITELNFVHLEQLELDPEWQKAQADSIREIMDEQAKQQDSEWRRSSDEADVAER